MKVKKIAKRLRQFKKIHGNLPVRIYADHGQAAESVHDISLGFIDKDGEEIFIEDIAADRMDEYTKIIIISS